MHFTPPGARSARSYLLGDGMTTAAPGSTQGLYLIVSDIEQARTDLVARGIDVSEIFHQPPEACSTTAYYAGGTVHNGPGQELVARRCAPRARFLRRPPHLQRPCKWLGAPGGEAAARRPLTAHRHRLHAAATLRRHHPLTRVHHRQTQPDPAASTRRRTPGSPVSGAHALRRACRNTTAERSGHHRAAPTARTDPA